MLHPLYENKNYENLNMRIFFLALVPMPHAVASAAADANDVSVSVLYQALKASNSSPTAAAQILL